LLAGPTLKGMNREIAALSHLKTGVITGFKIFRNLRKH
jgi:hypothetical protein